MDALKQAVVDATFKMLRPEADWGSHLQEKMPWMDFEVHRIASATLHIRAKSPDEMSRYFLVKIVETS